MIKISVKLD